MVITFSIDKNNASGITKHCAIAINLKWMKKEMFYFYEKTNKLPKQIAINFT